MESFDIYGLIEQLERFEDMRSEENYSMGIIIDMLRERAELANPLKNIETG